jgi:hypothetical protein
MKIICIEEHTVDAAIAKASQQGQAAGAGYMADWGSRVDDKPPAFANVRPSLVQPKKSMELARDLGAGRIADMDEHGIDMQILSYSSSPQLAISSAGASTTKRACM